MKQSLGVALQVKIQERIEKKLDALLRLAMGEEAGQALIDEMAQPVNPARAKEAYEQQAVKDAETGGNAQQGQNAEAVTNAQQGQNADDASKTRQQAEALKAGRRGK